MRKFTLAATAAVLASTGIAAYVAAPAFAQMGMGHDETMTWAQAKAKADEMWVKLDVNKDGVLNQADRDAKSAEMFDKIDTNHDGSISKDEFIAHHRNMGEHMNEGEHKDGPMADMDHDGKGPDGPGHRREHGMEHGMGHGMGHGGMMGPMLAMADANKDGTITRAEYDAAVKAHFDKIDTNHDGKVTREERRAGFAAMHARDGEKAGGAMGKMPPPSDGE